MSEQELRSVLDAARAVLERTQAGVQDAFVALHGRVVEGERVQQAALDRYQPVAFELAWAAAETGAAASLLAYAEGLADAGDQRAGLPARLAAAGVADAANKVRDRFFASPGDYGLDGARVHEMLGDDESKGWVAQQLSADHLAALGAEVFARGLGEVERGLTDEHRMMRDTFRRFAADVVDPLAEAIHREDRLVPEEIIGPLAEMGLFGLSIPEEYGGFGGEDAIGMVLATEELSRGSLGAAGSLITRPEILARALQVGGTEEQKQRWLPGLAMGDPLCAVAVTEPDYGSDVAGMRFRATKVEDGWRLDGAKTWCTFGGKAQLLLVLARTEPDPALGHRGLSLLLVEKPSFDGHEFEVAQDGGGTMAGRAIPTIGYRGMHSFEVFFDRYVVPEDALIGGEAGRGKGFYYQMAGFAGGRIQTAARALGVMQAAFDRARQYADERHVFGQPIGAWPLSQVKFARMAIQLLSSRTYTYEVARRMNEGGGQLEASVVKLYSCRMAEQLTREAMQLHGGMGYAEETAVSRYFLDARVLSIFEGAEEILALRVIARGLLDRITASPEASR